MTIKTIEVTHNDNMPSKSHQWCYHTDNMENNMCLVHVEDASQNFFVGEICPQAGFDGKVLAIKTDSTHETKRPIQG